jgi:protein TonB
MLGMLAAVLMQGAASPPGLIVQPNWLEKPNGQQITNDYPPAARKLGIGGAATIHCGITAEGRLSDCRVEAGEPAGAGFGDTALKLSRGFRMAPLSRDGLPTSGGTINLPFRFPPMS